MKCPYCDYVQKHIHVYQHEQEGFLYPIILNQNNLNLDIEMKQCRSYLDADDKYIGEEYRSLYGCPKCNKVFMI